MGFASGFSTGYNVATDARRRRRQREQEKAMAEVATAEPQVVQQFTPEQGEQLRSAADSGQYDVVYDDERKQYSVRAKSDPSATGEIAPQQRTQLLGKTYDQPPDAAIVSRDRRAAMAGVMDRFGDVEGASRVRADLRAEARDERDAAESKLRGERDEQRFEWEKSDRERAARYEEGRRRLFTESIYGQRAQTYGTRLQEYRAQLAAYEKAVESGDRSALRPVEPAKPDYSPAEALLDYARFAAHDIENGKADSQALVRFAEARRKVADEGYVRTLQLAQSGAPLTRVIEAFNASGEDKIDPASVVSDKMVDRGGGMKARVLTLRLPDGATRTIDTLAELDAMGQADKIFTRAFQANTDRRADNADRRGAAADARAAQSHEAGAAQRQLSQTLAELQNRLLDPKLSQQERTEIQGRIAAARAPDAKPPAFKVESGDITTLLGTPAVDAKGAPIMDPMTGRQVVNRDPQSERRFFAWMRNEGITDTNEALAKYPPLQGREIAAEAKPSKPANEQAAHDEARRAIARGAAREQINERLKSWGYRPVP